MLIEQADISRSKRKKLLIIVSGAAYFTKLFRSQFLERKRGRIVWHMIITNDHEERELITLVDEQGNETLFEIL